MKTTLMLGLLLLLPASVVRAGDDPDAAKAKVAVESFRKAWKSDSMRVRMDALLELAKTGHPLAVEEIGKTALVDPDPEVRGAAALALSRSRADPAVAGPILAKRLPKEEDFPEVEVAIIRAIAALGYRDARDALIDAAMHFREEEYRFVTAEVMRAFGKLKDKAALPFLLQLLEYRGKTLRGRSGPRVHASSDAEAKRIYIAKYGKFAVPKGTPETVVKWWLQDLVAAAHEITGAELEGVESLRDWMKEHARELHYTARDLHPPPLKPKPARKPGKDRGSEREKKD